VSDAGALVDILEAIYRLELPETDWVPGIMRAITARLGGDRGTGGLLYDASDDDHFRLHQLFGIGLTDEWIEVGLQQHPLPDYSRTMVAAYRRVLCGTTGEFTFEMEAVVREQMQRHGVGEQFLMNGIDPSHHGLAVFLFSSERVALSRARRALLERIATHLATAYRLRRRLAVAERSGGTGGEAILRSDGRVEHAEGAALEQNARLALRDAVQQREWARRRSQRDSPEALTRWRTMVAGRWTLLDSAETGGQRLVVARENTWVPRAGTPLSPRESQVASLAVLGRTNKVIAYELGLSDSTVRVLMKRAAAKLGVRTRAELVDSYRTPARARAPRLRTRLP